MQGTKRTKLEEARRRWGGARVLTGNTKPKPFTPAPAGVAVAFTYSQSVRRAA